MGIFDIYAQEQRELMNRLPKDSPKAREAQRRYLFYQAVSRFDAHELYEIMDAGIYDQAVAGYLLLALERADLTEEYQRMILDSVRDVMDEYKAEKAERYIREKYQVLSGS